MLSGYLATASFVRRGSLIDYAVARALRIYPALIVATLLFAFDKHGDFSYGLYLYAFPLQQLSIYYFGGDNTLLRNTITFVAAITMAAISWRFVEKQCLAPKKPVSARLAALFDRAKVELT